MRNIQIIIEYDGTKYCGWQIQKNGISIQEKLIDSIKKVTKEDICLIGSGRTDAGVHALGQSANFLTSCSIPILNIPAAVNRNLPRDIRVLNAVERDLEFHSRYDATSKVYKYRILNNEHGSGLRCNRVYHVRKTLDYQKMSLASKHFIGTHDFTSFSSKHSTVDDKVRTVMISDLNTIGDEIIYTIEGTGFLYNMVRIIVGTLIYVGLGKLGHGEIPKLIDAKDRNFAGPTAPACGLYLQEVLFDS